MSVSFEEEKIMTNELFSLRKKLLQIKLSSFSRKLIEKEIQSLALKLGKLKISKNKNFESQTLRDSKYDPPITTKFQKSDTNLFSLKEKISEKTDSGSHKKMKFLSTKFNHHSILDNSDDDNSEIFHHHDTNSIHSYNSQPQFGHKSLFPHIKNHEQSQKYYIPSIYHDQVQPILTMQRSLPNNLNQCNDNHVFLTRTNKPGQSSYSCRSHTRSTSITPKHKRHRKYQKNKRCSGYSHSDHITSTIASQSYSNSNRSTYSLQSRSPSISRALSSDRGNLSDDATTMSMEEYSIRKNRKKKLKKLAKLNSIKSSNNKLLHSSRSHNNLHKREVRVSSPITNAGKSKRERFLKQFAKLLDK